MDMLLILYNDCDVVRSVFQSTSIIITGELHYSMTSR